MNGIIGEFRLGEDISIALDATSGDASTVTSLTAAMKPALIVGNRVVLDDTATGIAMTVAPQVPASAGWIISLANAATSGLAAGVYGIDARLNFASSVEITEQSAFVRLSRATVA